MDTDNLAQALEEKLMDKYGPILTGNTLRQCLGYPTMGALRQAAQLGKLPVPVFTPKNRRGQFALTIDVALWLAKERENSNTNKRQATVKTKKGGDSEY